MSQASNIVNLGNRVYVELACGDCEVCHKERGLVDVESPINFVEDLLHLKELDHTNCDGVGSLLAVNMAVR